MKRFACLLVVLVCIVATASAVENAKKKPDIGAEAPRPSVTATFTVTEADDQISAQRDISVGAGKGFLNLLDPGFTYDVGDELQVTITVVKKGDGKTAKIAHREGDKTCACKFCVEERRDAANYKAVIDAGLPANGAPVDTKKLREALLKLGEE